VFEKLVTLPEADKKIDFKFVIDGEWTTSHLLPTETDSEGNVNNYITPDMITKSGVVAASVAAVSGIVGGAATTLGLAAKQPVTTPSKGPGGFPETPAEEPQSFSVNPLPATEGLGNPIKLAPGEPVPPASAITANTLTSKVTTDKETYEKGPGAGAEPTSVAAMTTLPPLEKNMIPESSLPIGAVPATVQSAGAGSTTAELAGQVPLENKAVPAIVKESQNEAKEPAEASAIPASVEKKTAVESELKSTVPTIAPTHETHANLGTAGEYAAGAAAAIGGAALAAGAFLHEKTAPLQEKAAPYLTQANEKAAPLTAKAHPYLEKAEKAAAPYIAQVEAATEPFTHRVQEKMADDTRTPAPEVPATVAASMAKAHKAPEAAGSEEAVLEKSAMEQELLTKVKTEEYPDVPAPDITGTKKPAAVEKVEAAVAAHTGEGHASSSTAAATTEAPTSTKKKRQSILFRIKNKLSSKK
jgi:hypothetical protein